MSYCNIPSILTECNTNSDHTQEETDSSDQSSIDPDNYYPPTSRSSSQIASIEQTRARTLSHQDSLASEHHDEQHNLVPSSASKSREIDITSSALLSSSSKAKSTSTSTINSQQALSFVEKLDHDLIDDTLLSLLDSSAFEFREHQPASGKPKSSANNNFHAFFRRLARENRLVWFERDRQRNY